VETNIRLLYCGVHQSIDVRATRQKRFMHRTTSSCFVLNGSNDDMQTNISLRKLTVAAVLWMCANGGATNNHVVLVGAQLRGEEFEIIRIKNEPTTCASYNGKRIPSDFSMCYYLRAELGGIYGF
jgi:hypothetical protein